MASTSHLFCLGSIFPLGSYSRKHLLPRANTSGAKFSTHIFAMANEDRILFEEYNIKNRVPHVLTVAGSDSGGGAGIQADIKTCASRGVYCSTVLTALTAQNTLGVQGVQIVPDEFVSQQLRSVLSDMQIDVVKTGLLPCMGIVKVLSQMLKDFPVRALVVDPVMVSTSGHMLADPMVLDALREDLLPLAELVTPNIKEASALLGGVRMNSVDDMHSAAKSIHSMGPRNVLVKGGDLPASTDAVDVFFDGETFCELRSARVETRNNHGTGCTLASCIAAELAKGSHMLQGIKEAKKYVSTALNYSKDITIGNGLHGSFDHTLRLKNSIYNTRNRSAFDPEDLFLYAITDSGMNKRWDRSMVDAVESALDGGATMVQLREKGVKSREFLETAKACTRICHSRGVPLLINDRVDIALASGADGVHVGQSDMCTQDVRVLLGPEKIIGVSCKTAEQAHRAWVDGADYIGCGGIYPTMTKPDNLTIGLDGLRNICSASKLPVVAIGGINASNVHAVLDIFAPNLKGIAVVSAIFDKHSVFEATKKLDAEMAQVVSQIFL